MYRFRKIRLIILLVIASFQINPFNSVHARQQNQAPPAQQQRTGELAQPAEQKQPDYSQEAVVVEQNKVSYRFENDGTGQREISFRVKVQSAAGVQNFGQLFFPYRSMDEKLEIAQVRVVKQDGSIVTASESNVQELTAPVSQIAPVYTDLKAKHVTVPGLRPGDLLEYRVNWRVMTPLAPNHFWLEHDFIKYGAIVLDESLEVNIPQNKAVKLKVEPGLDPTIKEENGRRIYSWKRATLKRQEVKIDKTVRTSMNMTELYEPKPPQIQMTTFRSWEEVGRWYSELQRSRIIPDDKIRAKAAELTRGLKSDTEKIEALYRYVANNIRYVSLSFGQGRYQPHAATEVLTNEYGDCKDKHALLASLLLAAGVHAYPALIHSSHKIDRDMPSPAQVNHVITAIPLGGETIWMDATTELAPFRMLLSALRKKEALLIPEDAPARLETTPADLPFPSKELIELDGKINDKGDLIARAHVTLRGDSELRLRLIFRRTPKAEQHSLRHLLTYLLGLEDATEIAEIKPSDPGETGKPFELELDVTVKEYMDWNSSRTGQLRLPLPSFRLPYADADKEQPKPIEFGLASDITYRMRLSLPANFQARLPVPITVKRDYAEYRSSYKLEENILIAERSLSLRQSEIAGSRAQDYLAFRNSTQADERQVVSIKTAAAATPSFPDSMTAEELLKAASEAEDKEDYELAEELLERVLAKEPKHKVAHGRLGSVRLQQGKYELAIEALREQTKINPFDDSAYEFLGEAFWALRKYEDAEAAFRKQIEVTPLDILSHGNLGLMLVQLRKYKEAVPELERAIALAPGEDLDYQIGLGEAYANLGQSRKAIEAFGQAVKLSHDAETLNEVAYKLAISDLQLDKAQAYAEDAVTDVATELRNARLEQLTTDDLASVRNLAAYWDTLGFVHFKKGNLDLAEKYMMAAWQVEQYSEVAVHLGQISEKRGRKEEAIHWYTLAAAGVQLAPAALENLTRLAGTDKVEPRVSKAKDELVESRTIKLGPLLKDEKERLQGEFFVVIAPGVAGNIKVAGVKLIRGSEKLRRLEDALQSATYRMSFPDQTATKIIRRGLLTCEPTSGGCTFVLLSPAYVSSVD